MRATIANAKLAFNSILFAIAIGVFLTTPELLYEKQAKLLLFLISTIYGVSRRALPELSTVSGDKGGGGGNRVFDAPVDGFSGFALPFIEQKSSYY